VIFRISLNRQKTTMQIENDLIVVENSIEKNFKELVECSRHKDDKLFQQNLIEDIKFQIPELKQAFEYDKLSNKEDLNTPVDPEKLIRAKKIRIMLKLVYDCFSKNDTGTLRSYFKKLNIG
jgi:hypothetical protein